MSDENTPVTPVTPETPVTPTPEETTTGRPGDKTEENQALEEAVAEKDGSAALKGDGVETETSSDVFFDGRKVVRVLSRELQGPNYPEFVRSEMSDATTVDVPRNLFSESDLSDLKDEESK